MTELTPFGIALRKLRVEKHLRLLDVARKLDVSAAFLSAIETGKKTIPDGFVTKLSRALLLTAPEIAELRKASDRTRTEVRLDNKKEEDRELIAALARRVDNLSPAEREAIWKLLKSIANEEPFQRRRRGIVVPALS